MLSSLFVYSFQLKLPPLGMQRPWPPCLTFLLLVYVAADFQSKRLVVTSCNTASIHFQILRIVGLLRHLAVVGGSRSSSLLALEGCCLIGQELRHFFTGVSDCRWLTLHTAETDSLLTCHERADGVKVLHLVDGCVREVFAHAVLHATEADALSGRT